MYSTSPHKHLHNQLISNVIYRPFQISCMRWKWNRSRWGKKLYLSDKESRCFQFSLLPQRKLWTGSEKKNKFKTATCYLLSVHALEQFFFSRRHVIPSYSKGVQAHWCKTCILIHFRSAHQPFFRPAQPNNLKEKTQPRVSAIIIRHPSLRTEAPNYKGRNFCKDPHPMQNKSSAHANHANKPTVQIRCNFCLWKQPQIKDLCLAWQAQVW